MKLSTFKIEILEVVLGFAILILGACAIEYSWSWIDGMGSLVGGGVIIGMSLGEMEATHLPEEKEKAK